MVKTKKRACVLRWGAFGDMIMITPLLRALHEDGYHVTLNCTKNGVVLRHNPFIDAIVEYKDGTVKKEDLEAYWSDLAKQFDLFINLSGSIEETLLVSERSMEYDLPHELRDKLLTKNYYDHTMEVGGYSDRLGTLGELYFSRLEHTIAKKLRQKHKNKFLILWSLSGSAAHKVYPHAEIVARAFFEGRQDVLVLLVGDAACIMLEWSHKQTKCYSGLWPIRKSLIMTQYSDLVVSTETCVAVAAGCFETPKIVLLSHAGEENLTKYWKNCTALSAADVGCQPCHRLITNLNSCELSENFEGLCPACMQRLPPRMLYDAIDSEYQKWKSKRSGRNKK
jgi:ADP-heptose:LPS heptosyltransferase